jgi:hypothetical protein
LAITIRVVTVSNRVVFCTFLLVVGLIVVLIAPGLYNPEWEKGWFYPVFFFGMPLIWVAGMVTGAAAVALHLSGRWEGFWGSAAPVVLGVVCLFNMMASIPPPPVVGAAISAILGAACLVALGRRGAHWRRWGILPLLALPFLGLIEPLAFWAPLAAALVFFGTWAWTRFGPIRDRLRSA